MNVSIEESLGVAADQASEEIVSIVLEALNDGEAHTTETLNMILDEHGVDGGCVTASALATLERRGYPIKGLGPLDPIFESYSRFKMEAQEQ